MRPGRCSLWLLAAWLLATVLLLCPPFASFAATAGDPPAAQAGARRASGRRVTGRVRFDIPAQPLASALRAFGRIAQIQILYDSDLRGQRRSRAVRGVFTPEEAMQILLTGTGLVASYTAADDVVLTLSPPPGATAGPLPEMSGEGAGTLSLDTLHVWAPTAPLLRDDAGTEQWYATAAQLAIQRALQRDPAVRGGNYRVLVRVWIDAGGTIDRLTLARSTGAAPRDAAIAHALEGLPLGPPPRGLHLPLGIVLTALP